VGREAAKARCRNFLGSGNREDAGCGAMFGQPECIRMDERGTGEGHPGRKDPRKGQRWKYSEAIVDPEMEAVLKPVQKLAGSGDPAYKGSISRQFL
jgi:hypothetical protein